MGNLLLVNFAVFVFAIVPYLYLHDESWQVQGSSAHWALDKGKYLPASGLQKIFMNIFVSCLVSGRTVIAEAVLAIFAEGIPAIVTAWKWSHWYSTQIHIANNICYLRMLKSMLLELVNMHAGSGTACCHDSRFY